jgi:cation/acetate symporter
VISSSASHDLYFRYVDHHASERRRLFVSRVAMALAVLVAIYFGINPPAFVGQVVAFAFGLAASTFFPILLLGIFWKRTNAAGAVSGMLTGLVFTASYMIYTLDVFGTSAHAHIMGVSPEGIGAVGAVLNLVVTVVVSMLTRPPSEHVQEMVEEIRYPARRRVPVDTRD